MTHHLNGRQVSSSAKTALVPLFGLTMVAALGASQAVASDLVPHRAVYELSLLDAERNSGIAYASGLFVFEVTGGACEGWTLSSDMILSIEGGAGGAIRTQTSYRAFEDATGQIFTFQSNTETNDEEPISVTGAAEREASGSISIRRFADRETSTAAIAETVFPNQLTEAVLAAAQGGERIMFSTVFDGSHDTGLAQPVTAVIGEPTEATVLGPISIASAQESEGEPVWEDYPSPTRAWPVKLSYFDPVDADAGPSFVVDFLLDTNGVSDQLVMDYGSFTLRGDLADFAPFRAEVCE